MVGPFDFILNYSHVFIEGFIVSVEVTLVSVFIGLGLGILAAIGDLYGGRITRIIVNAYVEFFRGSPLIAQLFVFYFAIPSLLNFIIDPVLAGLIVLSLNSGAYQKGYIKGAMEAVFKDQVMAAMSIGLKTHQILLYVVIPQALRIVIPAWSNELASMAKSTAALLVIGIREFTSASKTVAAQTFKPLETYAFAALIYFIWIYTMLKILDIVYERVKIPGLEAVV